MAANASSPAAPSSKSESLDGSIDYVLTDVRKDDAPGASVVPDATGEIPIVEDEDSAALAASAERVEAAHAPIGGEVAQLEPPAAALGEPAVVETGAADAPEAPTVEPAEPATTAGPEEQVVEPASAHAGQSESAHESSAAPAAAAPEPESSTVDAPPPPSEIEVAALPVDQPAPAAEAAAGDAGDGASKDTESMASDAELLDRLVLRPSGAPAGAQPAAVMGLQSSDDKTVISEPPPGVLAAAAADEARTSGGSGAQAASAFGAILARGNSKAKLQLSSLQLGLVIVLSGSFGAGLTALLRGKGEAPPPAVATQVQPAAASSVGNAPPAAPAIVPLPSAPAVIAPAPTPSPETGAEAEAARKAAAAKRAAAAPRRARKAGAKKEWTDPFGQ
jgi:hypothetical protein